MTVLSPPAQLPFLSAICWQLKDVHVLTPKEMLQSYERGWHYYGNLDEASPEELAFLQALIIAHGSCLAHDIATHISRQPVFQQPQHQQILKILNGLNGEWLKDCQVYFGGGTLLALKYDEYRLSKDIDFLCSSQQGYRQLRQSIFQDNYAALFQNQAGFGFPRQIRADRYGIRFPVEIEGKIIRLEIVSEGRIELEPGESFNWCPVSCLSHVDSVAEKLLANSDRWNDTSVLSRDLIDLAMLRFHDALPAEAFTKAEAAYPVVEPLRRAIAWFEEQPNYQSRCYELLQISDADSIRCGLALLKKEMN